MSLIEAHDLSVTFNVSAGAFGSGSARLRAVDRVSFSVERGECLAIVGESGCGKTTLGRTLIGLNPQATGRLSYDGASVGDLRGPDRRDFQRRVQMVFQDPYASLNPRMKVGPIIAEPLRIHGIGSGSERRSRVAQLLDLVGMPQSAADRFPQDFSGGQRQRIGIARALALRPEMIVADEPVSALDVSIQAQVINLLMELQRDLGLTLVFIAHDLAVVRRIATRIMVMHLGQIVEMGRVGEVFDTPRHPYTQALLSAVPIPDPVIERARQRIVLADDMPSPVNPPPGCRFHTRCPLVYDRCRVEEPLLLPHGASRAACHLLDGEAPR